MSSEELSYTGKKTKRTIEVNATQKKHVKTGTLDKNKFSIFGDVETNKKTREKNNSNKGLTLEADLKQWKKKRTVKKDIFSTEKPKLELKRQLKSRNFNEANRDKERVKPVSQSLRNILLDEADDEKHGISSQKTDTDTGSNDVNKSDVANHLTELTTKRSTDVDENIRKEKPTCYEENTSRKHNEETISSDKNFDDREKPVDEKEKKITNVALKEDQLSNTEIGKSPKTEVLKNFDNETKIHQKNINESPNPTCHEENTSRKHNEETISSDKHIGDSEKPVDEKEKKITNAAPKEDQLSNTEIRKSPKTEVLKNSDTETKIHQKNINESPKEECIKSEPPKKDKLAKNSKNDESKKHHKMVEKNEHKNKTVVDHDKRFICNLIAAGNEFKKGAIIESGRTRQNIDEQEYIRRLENSDKWMYIAHGYEKSDPNSGGWIPHAQGNTLEVFRPLDGDERKDEHPHSMYFVNNLMKELEGYSDRWQSFLK